MQAKIDSMVQKAEKFCAGNEPNKVKIEAKNGSGNYPFGIRNTLNEEKLKDNSKVATKKRSRLQCRNFAWTTL